MKKALLAMLLAVLPFSARADDIVVSWNGTGAYTNAAGKVFYLGTTNVAASTTLDLSALSTPLIIPEGVTKMRVYWGFTAPGATGTNILYFSPGVTSPTFTTNYDSYAQSLMKLTATYSTAGSVQVSSWFSCDGLKFVIPSAIVSSAGGTTSNNYVRICFKRPGI